MRHTPNFDILGIGTAAVDDLLHVDRYPPPDHKEPVRKASRQCGGQIATALAAAARLGARCAYAAVLGHDDLSAFLERSLREAGIDCRRIIHEPGCGPIHSVIIVDDSAHTRNIFFNRSVIRSIPPEAVTEQLVAGARVLLIDQFGSDEMIAAAQHAQRLGLPVVADMEWPDRARMRELMEQVDHLIVPRDFAAVVTHCGDEPEMTRELHRMRPRQCTSVTCGKEGCCYITGAESSEVQHQPSFDVEPVETTGCGDVFHGAYAASLAAGHGVAECIKYASAAAAVYASRPSGWHHLPNRADVASLLK
jgi:sulfofructose kinase